jgi:DNA-binding CsgD family transcriptional regulator
MATPSSIHGRTAGLVGRSGERHALDELADAVRRGESRALVVRGEAGVGKTALLDDAAERASGLRVLRASGVQAEMELAYASLHQLLGPLLDRLERLPVPQRAALQAAFAIAPGPAPDRFFVALAVLSVLSDAAERQPLICLVDDEQWVDRASAQALAVVARRLEVESVGLVLAAREATEELAGLPELTVGALSDDDARALLDSLLTAPLDARVRERIIGETHGNPLAILELVGGSTPAQLAGGFALPDGTPIVTSIEESYRRRLDALPDDSRRLVRLAAADPVGEPLLVWRAAGRLGLAPEATEPAAAAGLLEITGRVRFRHPLVRSAAYRSASIEERRAIHHALAEATDPQEDPDRRAWHLAHAAPGPDEEVAAELERSAGRAQARGGLSAAAAFLERAALVTPEPHRRATRLLAAAAAARDAGALEKALELLATIEAGPVDDAVTAEVERLRGQIALEQQRGRDAARLLLNAARRMESLDAARARETHLEALVAALYFDDADGVLAAAEAARAAPHGLEPPRVTDALLDALALRLTKGYAAAAPALRRALDRLVAAADAGDPSASLTILRPAVLVASDLWDADLFQRMAERVATAARDSGALAPLRLALHLLASTHMYAGELETADSLMDEDRAIAEATGNAPVPYTAMLLAAWRGREPEALPLIEQTLRQADARGLGRFAAAAACARAVLENGLGRHDAARIAAWRAFEPGDIGFSQIAAPELAEAAARIGDVAQLELTREWMAERARFAPSDWALGIEARVGALMSAGEDAEALYRASIERLGRTRIRVQLARGHLLYGEWLRRERRRVDAREQLRTAHELLSAMGLEAFAERAERELLATGETARRRTAETSDELTAQEAQIARLARDGLTNPEIGTRLFISPRTVQYHLRHVFLKLGISARTELDRVLPRDGR